MIEIDALAAQRGAEEIAQRLAPDGLAPEFLREAVWLRWLVGRGPPSDAEVIEYVARCVSDHVPVSGRQEHEPPPTVTELYRTREGEVIEIVEPKARGGGGRERGGRRRVAVWRTTGAPLQPLCRATTRSLIHRELERRHPGGTWLVDIATRDLYRVRERWGLRLG